MDIQTLKHLNEADWCARKYAWRRLRRVLISPNNSTGSVGWALAEVEPEEFGLPASDGWGIAMPEDMSSRSPSLSQTSLPFTSLPYFITNMFSQLRNWLLKSYLRTPDHPCKYRVVKWLGKVVFPSSGVRASAYPELDLMLHPRDWIEYLLLQGRRYEPLTLDFLKSNLRTGDCAILAGVNFGQHVAVAARAVGISGRVIGIEPQPAALLKARENLRLNGLSRQVMLLSLALGRKTELLSMAWSLEENSGAASLLDKGEG